MISDIDLIDKISRIIHFKEAKSYYAAKFGVSEQRVVDVWPQVLKLQKSPVERHSKILLLDIETSPLITYVFQKSVWKAKITHDRVISDWFILTWAAKWLGDKHIFSDKLTRGEAQSGNDKRIVESICEMLEEADVVIGHNSIDFDIPNILTRCVAHKFPPPSPWKNIDTKRVAKSQFGFTHNSLDALGDFLNVGRKIETDFELWKRCLVGDEEALEEMRVYNENDVTLLENVYLVLRPFIKGHPNMDLYHNESEPVCTSCGEGGLKLIPDKSFYTQAVRYDMYRCTKCGAVSRSKHGTPYSYKKKISPIPR